jgi:hypothetical protein
MARHASGPRIKHCPGLPSGGAIPSVRAEKLVESAFLHLESLKYPLISGRSRPAVQVCRVSPYHRLLQTSFSWQSLPGCVADNVCWATGGLICLSSKTRTKTVFSLSVTRAFVGGTLFRAYFRAAARHRVMLTFRSAMFVLSYDRSFHISLLCKISRSFMSFAFEALYLTSQNVSITSSRVLRSVWPPIGYT